VSGIQLPPLLTVVLALLPVLLLCVPLRSRLQRIVYVDNPDLGYIKGNQEIPAGAAFELEVELLSAVAGKSS
jgi:hypothetical protein